MNHSNSNKQNYANILQNYSIETQALKEISMQFLNKHNFNSVLILGLHPGYNTLMQPAYFDMRPMNAKQ